MKKYIFLLACLVVFSSCTDHKDLYNPDINPDSESDDNPLGIVVPDGFDWSMMATVNVTVAVDDKYNGQYYYVVEVFNENPAVASSANLLAKGVAKQGETFSAKVNVASALENLYVRKTTPTGRVEIRTFTIQNGNAYCDFTSTVSERSLSSRSAIARSFVDMMAPNPNDQNLFPTSLPGDAQEYVQGGGNKNWKIIKEGSYIINNWNAKGGNIYIDCEGIVKIDPVYINGANIYIIKGDITFTRSANSQNAALNDGGMISIGKKATVTIDYLQVQKANLYNLGKLDVQSKHYSTEVHKINESGELLGGSESVAVALDLVENSYFYNGGDAIIAGLRTSGSANILNEGMCIVEGNMILAADGHFVNDGECDVNEDTWIDNTNCSWLNRNNYETHDMNICAWNEFVQNNCSLKVNNMLSMNESIIIMDGGCYAYAAKLYMKNAKFALGSKSYLEIGDANLVYNRGTGNRGIYGVGSSDAVVSFSTLQYGETWFGGNLLVDYTKDSSLSSDIWKLGWENSVKWGNDAQIAKTECNPGYGNESETPTNPELPLEVMTSETCIYAMEDQWPSYGDYDMNDVVVRIKKSIATADNYVKHAIFEVWIEAVGADKTIGAALQLDGVTIEMLGTSVNGEVVIKHDAIDAISGFSLANPVTNCGENGHKNVVLPLFASANKLMGGNFVNVGKGKNEAPKKVQVDIYFKQGAVKPEALSYDKVNFFITTDGVGNGRTEIHLAGYKPTVLANSSLFGTGKDNPNSPYYSLDRMPWGIMIPVASWECPDERINIMTKYSGFAGWVTSGGQNNKDWYMYPVSPK